MHTATCDTVGPNLISHYKAENVTAVCNRVVSPTYCLCLSLPVLDFSFILVRREVHTRDDAASVSQRVLPVATLRVSILCISSVDCEDWSEEINNPRIPEKDS